MNRLLTVLAPLMAALLMAGQASAQEVTYYHTDALGSVVATSDENGNVIERREYEPFGRQLVPESLADGPGFTGHVSDAATGLSYMQQRYYDAFLQRFDSIDPITAYDNGDMRFFNRYAYAFSNPYRFKDPDGRETGAGYATGAYTMAMPTDTRSANIGVAVAAVLYGALLPGAAVAEVDAKGIALAVGLAAGDDGGLAAALAAIEERKAGAAVATKIVRKIITKDSTKPVSIQNQKPKPIIPQPKKPPPPPPPPNETTPPPPPPRELPPRKVSDT